MRELRQGRELVCPRSALKPGSGLNSSGCNSASHNQSHLRAPLKPGAGDQAAGSRGSPRPSPTSWWFCAGELDELHINTHKSHNPQRHMHTTHTHLRHTYTTHTTHTDIHIYPNTHPTNSHTLYMHTSVHRIHRHTPPAHTHTPTHPP